MTRLANRKWREPIIGLALLLVFPALADESWRDENYVLIGDFQNPELSRLLVFSGDSTQAMRKPAAVIDVNHDREMALAMTRSATATERVRGLTMLSGVDNPLALNAALVLLSDPVVAVREEAMHLVFAHPDADIGSTTIIGQNDPAARIRELTIELTAQRDGN